MKQKPTDPATEKATLHPHNLHRSRYDFPQLIQDVPALAAFVAPNAYQGLSIDFANPAAVKALNQALLKHFYGIVTWDIPPGYLCPPIPGRADYLNYLADLLMESNQGTLPPGQAIWALDVGVGANCIYPIIGHQAYGWHFVGSDIDPVAIRNAKQLVAANPALTGAISCRLQPVRTHILQGIVQPNERFDLTLCNPPFHASAAEAAAAGQRKRTNLAGPKTPQTRSNFGGQTTELWCAGGEAAFVQRLIAESALLPEQCFWFSSLISRKETLPMIYKALQRVGALDVRTIAMAQGQKKSRFVAWTFLAVEQQAQWREARWQKAKGASR